MSKWTKEYPEYSGSYICRMVGGFIKMCYWTGGEWLDMWQSNLIGVVKEWIKIPK